MNLPIPPLRNYQGIAVNFALKRFTHHRACYLAMEQGLGKTRCAITIADMLCASPIYIAPASLLENVTREFKMWAPHLKFASISDALIAREGIRRDIGSKVKQIRADNRRTLLIVDESHRFKTSDSTRTLALTQAFIPAFDYVLLLSGTPMPNGRPIELWPLLNSAAPDVFLTSLNSYAQRYCAARFDIKTNAWDFNGASNTGEFASKLHDSGFFFRLTKAEALSELPDFIEQRIYIEGYNPEHRFQLNDADADAYSNMNETARQELYPSILRRLLGVAKATSAISFLKDTFTKDESAIIFAYHTEVIDRLSDALTSASIEHGIITGATPTTGRQTLIDDFQQGCFPVLIANYLAGGVGFNITKASRIVFVEFSWVPGENEQAIGRAHRLGQKSSVLVQYLVFPDSFDEAMLRVNERKRKLINKTIDQVQI